jgi:MFS family permease
LGSESKSFPANFPCYYGWVIVGTALVTMLVAYGVWWSFSIFYVQILKEFGWSRGDTATIFSVGSIVYGFGSLVAGALVDRFGPRKLFPFACLLIAAGCLINSVARQLWHFYAAYGVFIGLGVICAGFVPMTVVISNWFFKKRGAALGVALIGNIQPPLLAVPIQYLIATFGWRISYAILGAVALFVIAPLTALLMRTRPQDVGLDPDGLSKKEGHEPSLRGIHNTVRPRYRIQIVNPKWAGTDWTLGRAAKTNPFWLLCAMMGTMGIGTGIIMHHLVAMAVDVGHSAALAAFIFSLAGIFAIMGRLGGYFSDRWGREIVFTIFAFFFILSSLSLLIMIHNGGVWPLYLYALAYGLGAGLTSPTFGAGMADLFIGRNFGAILGFINITYGIGQGIGVWAGGAIFDKTGSYTLALVTAIPLFAVMCFLFWLAGPRRVRKVMKAK